MEFGLQRIILIDSYLVGRVAEVDLSGHTNISGDNGAGKTSFLRLIPLFYGDQPRNLVVKTENGKVSFTEWYLPREGSYLVYEYLSHGELKMAVFIPKESAPFYQQLLVDTGYDESLFVDVSEYSILPARQLLVRLKGRGIAYQSCSSVREYREIIMDGKRGASQYSLCGRNGNMSTLVPLFTGMFHRSASFDDLAQVVQEYALNDLDTESRNNLENFVLHRERLTNTIQEYNAYHDLDNLKTSLNPLSEALGAHRENERKITSLLSAARSRAKQLQIEIDSTSDELKELDRIEIEEKNAHEQALSALSKTKEDNEKQRGPLVTERNDIKRSLIAYEKADMPMRKRRLDQLGEHENERNLRKQELDRLDGDLADITTPIEDARKAENDQLREKRLSSATEQNQLSAEEQSTAKKLRQRQKQEARALQQKQEHDRQILELQKGELEKDKVRLEERKKSPPIDAQLTQQEILADEYFNRARQAAFDASKTQAAAQKLYEDSFTRRERANREYTEANRHFDAVEEEHDRVLALRNGLPDSLITFLNSESPGWQSTLGKIIQPELLHRTDLSPEQVAGADSEALFGITLNYSRLPEGQLTPQELQDRLNVLSKELEQAESRLNTAHKELESAHKHLQKCTDEREHAVRQAQEAERLSHSQYAEMESTRLRVSAAKQESHRQITAELLDINGRLSETTTNLERLLGEQERATEELEKRQQTEDQELADRFATQIQNIQTELDTFEARHKETMARLNEQLTMALKEGGIDPEKRDSLSRQVDRLTDLCREIEADRQRVENYEMFLRDEKPRLPELNELIGALDEAIRSTQRRIEQENNRWTEKVKELQALRQAKERLLSRKQTDLANLKSSNLEDPAPSSMGYAENDEFLAFYQTMEAPQLISEHAKLRKAEGDTRHNLQTIVDRFARIFDHYPGTASAQYWQNQQSNWSGTDNRSITRAQAVEDYFRTGQHETIRNTIHHGFHVLNQIDIYRKAMEGLESRIQRFNRSLNAQLETSIPFEMIDSVEPKITFELNELDYWKDIKALADQVRDWKHDAPESLPSEQLIMALQDYLTTFNDSRQSIGVSEFWRLIRFSFAVHIDGERKVARSPKELADVSSNGLSYLTLIVVFQGFVDLFRGAKPVAFTWALDELRDIDQKNTRALLSMLSEHNINLITACPDIDHATLGYFSGAYYLENKNQERKFIRWLNEDLADSTEENPFEIAQGAPA